MRFHGSELRGVEAGGGEEWRPIGGRNGLGRVADVFVRKGFVIEKAPVGIEVDADHAGLCDGRIVGLREGGGEQVVVQGMDSLRSGVPVVASPATPPPSEG